ncbi:MAG: homocysteine S-methyltransferase family protein [Nocardioidaceae bacterium]|nr:homocysteine S-methyltransferase family protein [Nocardioidaceae bacterium]
MREWVIVLDDGLATRLEARGHDLSDDLWSARLLIDDPGEIRAAHEDYAAAGAEAATTQDAERGRPEWPLLRR